MTDAYRRALSGSLQQFRNAEGPDIFQRLEPFLEWKEARHALGLWPLSRPLFESNRPKASSISNRGFLNFVRRDRLDLARHPDVIAAARAALEDFCTDADGPGLGPGRSHLTLELEEQLAEYLGIDHVLLFPSGLAAATEAIRRLVRPSDHVVLDDRSHAGLVDGAAAATPNLHVHTHADAAAVRRVLAHIRARDTSNAIVVATEALYSFESDSAQLSALQQAVREYGAFLLIDVCQDLGCVGAEGLGVIDRYGLAGKVDIVVGSFSYCFASIGGFVATRSPAAKQYMIVTSPTQAQSGPMSPIHAATALAALNVVRSSEGQARRAALATNVMAMRTEIAERSLLAGGAPSPLVPVMIGGDDLGRLACGISQRLGAELDLVEYPAVPRSQARFVLQLRSAHTRDQLGHVASIIRQSIDEAQAIRLALGSQGASSIAAVPRHL